MRVRGQVVWVVTSLVVGHATTDAAEAQCTAPLSAFLARGESIGVVAGEGVDGELVEEAIAIWQGCVNYAQGFPALRADVEGTRTVRVTMEPRNSRGPYCGTFSGSNIRLFAYYLDRNGKPQRCAEPGRNLAHELGHVLGLDDAPSGTACAETIMAPITVANASRRRVTPAECSLAGQKWLTPAEELRLATLGEVDPYELTIARFGASVVGAAVAGTTIGQRP